MHNKRKADTSPKAMRPRIAAPSVLAVEEVGGSDAGVNWLLADAQETVRDVARAAYATPAYVVDHVFFDAFGQENAPQSASDPQLQSPIGYEGMMIGPLFGFPSDLDAGGSGGSGGSAASDGGVGSANSEWDWGTSVIGLSYSVSQGWYDSVTGGYVTAAQQGYNSGVANPYVFQGDNPTITNLVASFRPADPTAAVGINTTTGDLSGGGAGPVWGLAGNEDYGTGAPCVILLTSTATKPGPVTPKPGPVTPKPGPVTPKPKPKPPIPDEPKGLPATTPPDEPRQPVKPGGTGKGAGPIIENDYFNNDDLTPSDAPDALDETGPRPPPPGFYDDDLAARRGAPLA